MPINIKKIIAFGCLVALPAFLSAQNNSSPYSVLGIGDIETSYFNRYTGMANAGIALADERYINNINAASLTKLRLHYFSFEISSRFKQIIYSGAGVTATANKTTDFAMRRVSLAAKVSKKWGSSLGLTPFSTAAFSYVANKNIQGSLLNVSADYEGEGGVNQFYWANGFQLTKNTSVGVTSSLLFGSISQTEQILSSDLSTTLTTKSNTYLRNYYFNLSLQTKLKLNKKWQSTYGITYSPKTSLLAEHSVNVTDGSVTIKNAITSNDYFAIPENLNLGIALIKNNQYTFTVNAQAQNWNALKYTGSNYQLVNSNKLSLGFQKSQKATNGLNMEYEKGFFQVGIYAGKSYIKMNDNQLTDFGGSIGYSKNLRNTQLGYVISVEGGRRGTRNAAQLSENYFNINLTLNYLDFLFGSKRYY